MSNDFVPHHPSDDAASADPAINSSLLADLTGAPAAAEPLDPDAPRVPSFEDMKLSSEVHQALEEMGYFTPTPVQSAVYASVANGKDVVVQSRTGTGKTAAFGLPILERLDPALKQVQALVLTPTRELAIQVCREIQALGKFKAVSIQPIYGGAPIGKQIEQLREGVHIVVGTPGRVLDHIGRRTFDTRHVRTFVLDECDEMLSMGFLEDIERVVSHLPKDKQTALFSATMPDEVSRFARRAMKDAEKIALSDTGVSVADISHAYYIVSGVARTRDLLKIILTDKPESAIIFCNTRDETSMVARFLQKQGLDAEPISSDLSQNERERVMQRMRDHNLRFLVATDVAARGIDITDLTHVINYTFPESAEVYVHRTGRTGRAGKKGTALSLIGPRELGSFYFLKLMYKIIPEERVLPPASILDGVLKASTMHVGAALPPDPVEIIANAVTGAVTAEQAAIVKKVLASPEGERVVAVLITEKLAAIAQAKKDAAKAAADAAEAARPPREERPDRDERPRYGRDRDERPRYGRDREERARDDRPRDDRPRDDRPREDRPAGDERPRFSRDDRPREDRPREDRPREDRPREDRPAGDERPRFSRDDRPRDDRPRDDRPRDDRPRDDRPRDDRPRDDRPRDDRPRDDRPRFSRDDRPRRDRDDRPRDDRPRDDRPRDAAPAEARDAAPVEVRDAAPRTEERPAADWRASREDRPRRDRDDRPRRDRDDRPRDDRPRDDRPRDDRPRDAAPVEAAPAEVRDNDAPREERPAVREDRPVEARDDRGPRRDRDDRGPRRDRDDRGPRADRAPREDRPVTARDDSPAPAAEAAPAPEPRIEAVAPPPARTEAPAEPRRKRGSKNGAIPTPPADTGREFWETWAEEKSTRPPEPVREERPAVREERPARAERAPREDRPAREGGRRERGGRDRERATTTDDRPPARAVVAAEDPGSLVRLYVSLGKEAGVTADDVRALLGKQLGDDASRIGSVAMRATHCYVRVPEDLVERIVSTVHGTQHNDAELKVELARA